MSNNPKKAPKKSVKFEQDVSIQNSVPVNQENSIQLKSIPSISLPITMDINIEKFKYKMDNMLNSLKLETLSELLNTKKSLIEENTKFVSSETIIYKEEIECKNFEVF